MISVGHERLILRELLRLETAAETEKLDNGTNICLMGLPFVQKDGAPVPPDQTLPILEFIFSRLIVTFPLFKTAKANFWPVTVQNFIQKLATADISSSADRDEATKRRRIARGIRRMMMMMLMAGLNTNRPKEETGRYKVDRKIFEETAPLPRVSAPPLEINFQTIKASVIGVNYVPGAMFKGSQHQFIVEAILPGDQVVYVMRTYADFQDFNRKLWKIFPGKQLVHLPSKITAASSITVDGRVVELPREKLRQMLRHYMNCLAKFPQVLACQAYLDFVACNTVNLTQENIVDIEARIELDKQRWKDYEAFNKLAQERGLKLQKYLSDIKSEILLEDALPKIFFEMKAHDKVEDMSEIVQKVVEYTKVEVASLIHANLIARDDSPELFSQIKRLHGLMPYKIMQGILMLSNPALIMKKLTDLFMATPFGSKSLLQKLFIGILADDSRSQGVLIEELRKVIQDDPLYEAIHSYAWSDHYNREAITSLSDQTNTDLVMCIIENSSLDQMEKAKVRSWHKSWQGAVDAATNAEDANVNKYSQLKDLYKLVVRQRDKEIMQDFWGEQETMKIIKQVVDMLYNILIEIFRTANVAESVGDLERFISDLIKVIDRATEGASLTANQVVEELIQVLDRHQNSVFKFINRVYSKEGGFFVEVVLWLTRIVNFIRIGKEGGNKLDLLALIDTSAEQGVIDEAILVKELNALDEWLILRKKTAAATKSSIELEEMAQNSGVNFGIDDFGLTWDDLDYGFAEAERDEQEEFLEREELGLDAVMREKQRRQNLAKIASRQNSLPPRPQSQELLKLLPKFEKLLTDNLPLVNTSASSISRGFAA